MNHDDGIRSAFREALSHLPEPQGPPVGDISRRARGHVARRRVGAIALAAGLAVAVVAPLVVISAIGNGGDLSGASDTTSPVALTDVGLVRCDQTGATVETTVLTPVIRPQPDGVHFRTDNRTGLRLAFMVADFGARNAPPGRHDVADGGWTIPPGTIQVRCFDGRRDAGNDEGYVPMTIEDPQDLWSSDRVECDYSGTGILDYVAGAKGGQGDPVDVARAFLAEFLEEGDQVRRVGYPEAASPVVGFIRNGQLFATVTLRSDGQGGWLPSEDTRCTDPPPPPEVVQVTCNQKGTHVRTEPVFRQADGVHFKVDNPQDGAVTLEVEGYGSASSPPGFRNLSYPPTGELGWPIPTGTIRVRCSGSGVPISKKDQGWHEVILADSP